MRRSMRYVSPPSPLLRLHEMRPLSPQTQPLFRHRSWRHLPFCLTSQEVPPFLAGKRGHASLSMCERRRNWRRRAWRRWSTPTRRRCRFAAPTPNRNRGEKHRPQWKTTLRVCAEPLRAKPGDRVETTDILAALRPIWQTKPETASRIRARVEHALNAAKAKAIGSARARQRGVGALRTYFRGNPPHPRPPRGEAVRIKRSPGRA